MSIGRMVWYFLALGLCGCTKAAFIGDSITYVMAGSLPPNQVSFAVNGYTSTDMFKEQLQPALASVPLAVPILAGTNDVQLGRKSIEDLKSMARRARAAGSCVILATLPPCTFCDQQALRAWNSKVLGFAIEEHYPVADYARTVTVGMLADGIHPTQEGVDTMMGVIQPLIRSCPNVISAEQ